MNLLWVPELQRRLDEEGAPITVMTVHPGTVSTGTRPLPLETQRQHADNIRYTEGILSVVAETVHYAESDVHPAAPGRLDDAFRGDERGRGGGARKVQGGVHRAIREDRPASAQGGARPRARNTAVGRDGPCGRRGVGAVTAAMRLTAVRIEASEDGVKLRARFGNPFVRRFSAHVGGHFRLFCRGPVLGLVP